ncbi:MAG TPA: hypothetical protein VK689_21205 [Armatimonadota bacterium]|nr:hypothetical protein [Armatimonadota bacterium]
MTGSTALRRVGSLLLGLALLGLTGGRLAAAPADTRIAFAVDTAPDGRASRIYVANADGTGARAISPGATRDRSPAFSPDGKSIAYQTSNDLGMDVLVVQPVDGGEPRRVATGSHPDWSRDGKSLLFSRRLTNEHGLYVIRADGSQKDAGLKPIAKGRIGRWSPDGRQLATVAPVILEGQDRWQIQVMPSDTLQPKFRLSLPETYGQVVSLQWSPNAQSLLFSVARQNQHDLYVLDLKSPEPRKVPAGLGGLNAAYGSWSPDGSEILFRVSSGPAAAAAGATAGSSAAAPAASRLCLMNADGTRVRRLWEPENKLARIHATAWHLPPTAIAAATPKPMPLPAPPVTTPPVTPPPAVTPSPMPPVAGVGAPPRKVLEGKLFKVGKVRSPVSVSLAAPRARDFAVAVPVLPSRQWTPRRQGVGVTLELEDGSLYRGTVIFSGTPWVTLQGRAKGGKVRLIDGKQLPPETAGFQAGFKLTIRREGANLTVAVNDEPMLTRPVISADVKAVSLTLENFETRDALFPLGNIFYHELPVTAAR